MMTLSNLQRKVGLTMVSAIALCTPTFGAQAKKPAHKPTVKAVTAKPVAAPVAVGPMVGTWTLREGDKEIRYVRILFRPNGTFAFVGSSFRSEGTYRFAENSLKLAWTSIDGEPCKPGAVQHSYLLAEADGSLQINKHVYRKL
jgi:hypothetical protein